MPATEGVSRELLSEHRILLPQVNFLTVSLKLQNLKLAESLEKKRNAEISVRLLGMIAVTGHSTDQLE